MPGHETPFLNAILFDLSMSPITSRIVVQRLADSQLYRDYERAFCEATGLPLTLSPVEDWHLAHRKRRHESPLCALLAKQNKGYAVCLRYQHELTSGAQQHQYTVTRFGGLVTTAIPLRVGESLIGFLRTGDVLLHKPTTRGFSQLLRLLTKLGVQTEAENFREAYFRTHVFTPKKYESVLRLLRIFADHLLIVASQIIFQSENCEEPNISRARAHIAANLTEELSISTVSKVARMSRFYFCKQFKKITGFCFTDYVCRLRVEKAKEQLLNPNARIGEIAYKVGFGSLTHFNRIFRKLNGRSPTCYRDLGGMGNVTNETMNVTSRAWPVTIR